MEKKVEKDDIDSEAVAKTTDEKLPDDNSSLSVRGKLSREELRKVKDYFTLENPETANENDRFSSIYGTQIHLDELIKKLFLANPFYLVSACLVLYASTRLFHTDNVFIDNLIPLAVMTVYTALLAGTAIFLAKFGKVWDDTGMLMQINVMLFMAISVGLDGKIIDDTTAGTGWVAAGLAVMLAISEMMFTGLKLKIPVIFRFSYYTLMGFYFIYPWILAELVTLYEENKTPAIMGFMLFPIIAAILFILVVVPMIRKGPGLFSELGAPWKELRFPGNIFILILLGFGCRTYLNTISFFGGKGVGPYSVMETGYDSFMLIPLVAALAIVLMEYGKNRGKKLCIYVAMGTPLPILLMGTGNQDELFLKYIGNFGLPLYTCLFSIIIIFLYGWYMKIRGAAMASGISMFITSIILQNAYSSRGHVIALSAGRLPIYMAVLMAISMVIITIIMLRYSLVLGGIWAAMQTLTSLWIIFPGYWLFREYHHVLPVTAIYLTFLVGSSFIHGGLGMKIRKITGVFMPVLCIGAMVFACRNGSISLQLVSIGYCLMLLTVIWALAVYGHYLVFFLCGSAGACVTLVLGMIVLYRGIGGSGGRAMFWSVIFFAAALLMSMIKGKMFGKCNGRLMHIFNQ